MSDGAFSQGMPTRAKDQRLWSGMRPRALARLLEGHQDRIAPDRKALVRTLRTGAPVVGALAGLQALRFDRRVAETSLTAPPVVIIGCHRTGTTHLHKLLSLLPGWRAPTSYECFSASHFLISGGWMPRFVAPLVAPIRPMDAMPNDLAQPQEDDFALLSHNAPTPYRRVAFPAAADGGSDLPEDQDIDGDQTMDALDAFWRALTFRHGERLVLKSPYHTARTAALRARYPGLLLVHMTRDLGSVGPSTVNFWRRLEDGHRLGRPETDEAARAAFVARHFDWLYGRFLEDLPRIDPDAIHHVRYEDLVARPLDVVRSIWRKADGADPPDLAAVLRHVEQTRRFPVNTFPPNPGIYAATMHGAEYQARRQNDWKTAS